MSVGVETLFTGGLVLLDPWEVTKVSLDTHQRSIDFEVRCNPGISGARIAPPAQRCHDWLGRSWTWMYLDFFQFEAWQHADAPRVACNGCRRITQVGCPGLAQPMASRRYLKPWRCRYAESSRCDNPLNCCGALISPLAAHRVLHPTGARDDMGSAHTVGIDETSLRHEQPNGMLDNRSKALVEAANGMLQQAKRAARCLRAATNFIAIVYLRMHRWSHLPSHPFTHASAK